MFHKSPDGKPTDQHFMLRYIVNHMMPSEQEMMRNKNKLDGFDDEQMLKIELDKISKEQKMFETTRQINSIKNFDMMLRKSTEMGGR